MMSLSNLTDQQNMTLTQFSYCSSFLDGKVGQSFSMIASDLKKIEENGKKLDYEEQRFLDLMTEHSTDIENSPFADFVIEVVDNNPNTGFGAIVFKDSEGNKGFSFRGSDPFWDKEGNNWSDFQDWLDDISTAITGGSIQSNEAEEFFNKYKDKNGNNYFYGHSKGGELSQAVFINHLKDVKKLHLLNPQPINPYGLSNEQINALKSEKMDVVVVEGDYIWTLGAVVYENRVRYAECKQGENPHSYSAITFKGDSFILGNRNLIEIGYNTLENVIVQLIQIIYYGGFTIYEYAKDEMWPEIERFSNDFILYMKKTLKVVEKDIDQIKKFFNSVAKQTSVWFNKTFNAGYNYSTINTYISVNTSTLRNYASRLTKVNSRITKLDKRLDTLYGKVGLADLLSLLKTDALTGYSWRLNRCINYLNETAADFENVEKSIASGL